MKSLFIAGTDAQVGKTVVLSALLAYWQRYTGHRLGVMKPIDLVPDQTPAAPEAFTPAAISAASPSQRAASNRLTPDAELFNRLFQLNQPIEQITPCLLTGSALPPIVAEQTGLRLGLDRLWRQLQQMQQQHELVLLEGWGGLGSPLTTETTGADLAWDWRIPTVLVVPVQPGAVAQAVANVALANQARVYLKGIILNEMQPCSRQERESWVPVRLIQSLTRKPVLGYMPHLANPQDLNSLVQAATDLDIETLLPGVEQVFSG